MNPHLLHVVKGLTVVARHFCAAKYAGVEFNPIFARTDMKLMREDLDTINLLTPLADGWDWGFLKESR